MVSEYEPLTLPPPLEGDSDLERAQRLFAAAAAPFLRSAVPWVVWAVVLPAAALATRPLARLHPLAALLAWSAAIVVGGAVEGVAILSRGRPLRSELSRWVLRAQGNLSLVALVVSAALAFGGGVELVPGLWLLVLGHSLASFGGLALPGLRRGGRLYQLGGLVALTRAVDPFVVFAVTAAVANLATAVAVGRRPSADAA